MMEFPRTLTPADGPFARAEILGAVDVTVDLGAEPTAMVGALRIPIS